MMKTDLNSINKLTGQLKVISHPLRFEILIWILNPTDYFEKQIDGDLVEDGVCVGRLVTKSGYKQPTITNHLKLMAEHDLVLAKKIKNWVFYRPNRPAIAQMLSAMTEFIDIKH